MMMMIMMIMIHLFAALIAHQLPLSMVAVLDCGEAYSRIFNHRPVLQGEINFLLREFEVRNLRNEYWQGFNWPTICKISTRAGIDTH
jgi:Organelle biogenesis, Muted-like protein